MFDADGVPINAFDSDDVEDEDLHWEYVDFSTSSWFNLNFLTSLITYISLSPFVFFHPHTPTTVDSMLTLLATQIGSRYHNARDAPQFSWLVKNKTISKILQQEYGSVPFLEPTVARGPEYLFMSQGQLQGTSHLLVDDSSSMLNYGRRCQQYHLWIFVVCFFF